MMHLFDPFHELGKTLMAFLHHTFGRAYQPIWFGDEVTKDRRNKNSNWVSYPMVANPKTVKTE
jgi:hypothetical protein